MLDPIITNGLNLLLFLVFLSMSLRAFYLYSHVLLVRLFVLGLAMGLIALSAGADFVSGSITTVYLNTDWFLFIGQTISYIFIYLSIVINAEEHLRILMRWQIAISFALLTLLLLSPILPGFPSLGVRVLLSGSRSVICFLIFFCYAALAISKGTRFSMLMCLGFMLLSFGYLMILPRYFLPHADLINHAADTMRVFGVVSLFGGFALGK